MALNVIFRKAQINHGLEGLCVHLEVLDVVTAVVRYSFTLIIGECFLLLFLFLDALDDLSAGARPAARIPQMTARVKASMRATATMASDARTNWSCCEQCRLHANDGNDKMQSVLIRNT